MMIDDNGDDGDVNAGGGDTVTLHVRWTEEICIIWYYFLTIEPPSSAKTQLQCLFKLPDNAVKFARFSVMFFSLTGRIIIVWSEEKTPCNIIVMRKTNTNTRLLISMGGRIRRRIVAKR